MKPSKSLNVDRAVKIAADRSERCEISGASGIIEINRSATGQGVFDVDDGIYRRGLRTVIECPTWGNRHGAGDRTLD